jgi:hypothetical protein
LAGSRKVQWVVRDKDGNLLGVFPNKKRISLFIEDEDITLTKLVWNGFYHSEKPLDYDPYAEGKITLFTPMF